MKREYKKPQLVFESFQLDAAVAVGCDLQLWHTVYECHSDGNMSTGGNSEENIFFSFKNCLIDLVGDGDVHITECFHGPSVTGGVFLTS